MIIANLTSPLSEYFYEFVRMKRALGYKYDSDKLYWLRAIDKICAEHAGDVLCLSKRMVEAWGSQRPGESARNQHNRIGFSNEIAEFLLCRNIEAYILPAPKAKFLSASSFVPYVFTHEQIEKFLLAADAHPPHRAHPISSLMYSFLFRLLYCCGLRISEALSLKYNDVNLNAGVLTIRDGKFGKDRLVPMTASFGQLCSDYLPIVRTHHPESPFIFATRFSNTESITPRSVYEYFRKILWDAGIPHGGRGNGPRLHDFRHTFSVHSLQQWISTGEDVYAALPVLATYLGHDDLKITERYLRLTAEVFPEMIKLSETYSQAVIPEVRFYETD